jgi:hypothetical protein
MIGWRCGAARGTTDKFNARVASRVNDHPDLVWNYGGFRVVALPS